jgi:hypothetical protein
VIDAAGERPAAAVLVGTHSWPSADDAARRNGAAFRALRALERVEVVNVQFAHAPHEASGIRTLAALTRTSNDAADVSGPQKPLIPEVFDVLAAEAMRLGIPYFCYVNSDIHLAQAAIDWIRSAGREAYLLSREDVDPATGASHGIQVAGIDVVAMTTGWWTRNRTRFRDYIAGEPVWDNVCASIILCHADAVIENRLPLARHEQHGSPWRASPFAHYTRLLAAFDAGYFSLWCRYVDRLGVLRASGAGAAREAALAREVFQWRPSTLDRAVQTGRNVKARIRYALRAGW